MKLSRMVAAALAGLLLAGCGSEAPPGPGLNVAADALHEIAGLETARGMLVGRSDHAVSGTVSVFRSEGKWYVSLGRDFRFDGAPDPRVAFGADGFRQDAILGPLASDEGASVYEVVPPLDVGDYTEVWIWCEEFAVPLGYARLTLL